MLRQLSFLIPALRDNRELLALVGAAINLPDPATFHGYDNRGLLPIFNQGVGMMF